MKKYSIVDIETTGGCRSGNKIIELAIVNVDGTKVVEEFSTLIDPERSIPRSISYLTGISNEMISDSPKFYEIAKKVVEMTEGRIFVAHNVFFDYNFIKHEFRELGFLFSRERLCTVRLARKYLPGHQSYSLGKICRDLDIKIQNRHRALGDAKATVQLFLNILSQLDDLDAQDDRDMIFNESKKVLLPPNVDRKNYDLLPHGVGVYYFYNDKDELLYVGKSKDIKKRVQQHFRPDLKRKKDILLKNSIARIDYKLLGHELAALLYECHEIKSKWPPYNVTFKNRKFTYGVKLVFNDSGLLFPKIYSSIDPEEFVFQFKNKHAAQRKIEQTYKALLGDLKIIENLELKIQKMVSVIGKSEYNEILMKTFNYNIPKVDNFTLKLNKNLHIKVLNKKPVAIDHYNGSELEEHISLQFDPQMIGILWRYLHKHRYQYTEVR